MKNKIAVSTLSAAVLTALSAISAHANLSGFGIIPGDPAGAYGGTGIPTQPSSYTQGTIGDDTVTLALSTTAHGASNPAPTTTVDNVFNVGTGLNGTPARSLWNYDYYLNSSAGNLSAYTITLTVFNVGTGLSYAYNPLLVTDNSPSGSAGTAGNSESLDFIAGFIGYNANLNDTYDVTLTATDGRTTLSTTEQIIAGTGSTTPVPEPTTVVAGGLMLLPFGIGALRKFRKSAAPVA